MNAADRLASLGLPSELLAALAEMGMDVHQMLELPEYLYIQELMDIVQQLPDAVQKPIRARDAKAFISFLGDPAKGFFQKYLVLLCLNEATNFDQDHRYNGEHYVPPIATLLSQPDVPMFVVMLCYNILNTLSTNGERVLQEMCKVATLPSCIASFIERVCDDGETRNSVRNEANMFVEDSIKKFCSIVIKLCTSGRLQPSSSTPAFLHAEALLSTCLRLIRRFMPVRAEQAVVDLASQPPIEVKMPSTALELLWALGCLLGSSAVPFPQHDCRVWFNDLLLYIGTARERYTMHALLSCLYITISRLSTPPLAGDSVAPDAAAAQLQQNGEKQQTIRTLSQLLTQAPCDFGFSGQEQPKDFEAEGQGQQGARRQLVGTLSTLQKHTSFDLAFQIISQCVDGIEAASHFVLAENGALLAILSKRLNDSGSTRDAAMYISVCEAVIDILCGSNIRHAVSAGEPFPFDLIAPLHSEIQTDHFREFFKHAYRSPHAKRLHGGMVVPGCGDIPSMTLKQLANREEKSTGITVLGYAAAIDNRDAVRMLLQIGADPNLTGSNGKNAMEMTVQHNSHKADMLSMLQSIREVQVVVSIDPSCTDTEACKRITGRSAFELIAPVWDVLLDAAAATPHPEVSFAIFKSLFDTITAVHPAILENLFVDAVSSASANKTPRASASPQALDVSHAAADQSSPLSSTGEPSLQGFKLLASSRAERFLKLLGLIAKKFRRIGGVNAFAQCALRAILKLLKLPTARPLARLCHKLRLVDPTLSDLAISQGSGKNAALSPQASGVSSPAVDSPECEEEEEEEEADADGSNVDAANVDSSPVASVASAAAEALPSPLDALICELRSTLAPFITPLSGQSHIISEMENIASALKAAVFGSAAILPPNSPLMTAQDALCLLCDSKKHESYMEHLDTPQGFKVIEALCSFMSEDAPSPAPSDSASKVTRRAQFRNIFCATKMSCDKLKSLIRHLMAIFEEYHDDVLENLALFERRNQLSMHSQLQINSSTRTVHLLPIPGDEGCSQHFGSELSTFQHKLSMDFKNLATGLNCGDLVIQESELPDAGAVLPPQLRRQNAESFQVQWQILNIKFLPLSEVPNSFQDLKGCGKRFKPAIASPEFEAQRKLKSIVAFGGKMTKSQKKNAKQRAKLAAAASVKSPLDGPTFLSPRDISRVRLFLCYHADVQPDGCLPSNHLEIDPCLPLAEAVSEFERKFSGQSRSAPQIPHSGHKCIYPKGCPSDEPHKSEQYHSDHRSVERWSCCDQLVSDGSQYCSDAASKLVQPFAIFYGSGDDFVQCRVPDELQWCLKTLESEIADGRVLLLDVIVAVKNAMPESWLAEHGMSPDCLSIAFSKSHAEIIQVYQAALHAWGAADVIPPADVGLSASAASPDVLAPSNSSAACQNARLLLQAMQIVSDQLQICMTSHPVPPEPPAELGISGLEELQSKVLSARFNESARRGSGFQPYMQLSSLLPQVLDLNCREFLFRQISGTSHEHFQRIKKDRVNGVDRSCILDWAASIAAAIRGRRNPLAIRFSQEGVEEAGFGEAVTKSFFCNVAEAFSKADTGMWLIDIEQNVLKVGSRVHVEDQSVAKGQVGIICGEENRDTGKWHVQIVDEDGKHLHQGWFPTEHLNEIVINIQEPLLASNGLYVQPYCASVPMHPSILCRFELLGTMMAKALHDGRAFPLRISYALARCICGEDLVFDDLGGIIDSRRFHLLKMLHESVSSGSPISPETNVVEQGSRGIVPDISKRLHLVRDGDRIDVTMENAAEYLRAVERMYLGDGVAMQIRALKSGFYSVIEQSHVATLGPCGLLYQLGCLGVPEFDLQDLRGGLTPLAPYSSDSPQYLWLIEILSKFEEPDRLAFVRFVTGAPWLPSGFRGLRTPLELQLLTDKNNKPCDDSYAPFAQTCFGYLKIPLYTSANKLRDKLLEAIHDKYAPKTFLKEVQ